MGARAPRTFMDLTKELFPEFAEIADAWRIRGELAGVPSTPGETLRLTHDDLARVGRFLAAVLNIMVQALQGYRQTGMVAERIGEQDMGEVLGNAGMTLITIGAWLAQENRIHYAAPPSAAPGDGKGVTQ